MAQIDTVKEIKFYNSKSINGVLFEWTTIPHAYLIKATFDGICKLYTVPTLADVELFLNTYGEITKDNYEYR